MFQREKDLYPDVANYVDLRFSRYVRPRSGFLFKSVEITAQRGDQENGKWSRPDVCMLALWRYKYGVSFKLDLYGFEVKKQENVQVDAIHEALAHTRLVNYSYLVVPNQRNGYFDMLADNCKLHGVGLIRFSQAENADSYYITIEAKRYDPHPDTVDDFIDTRFSQQTQEIIAKYISPERR